MKVQGSFTFNGPPDQVWNLLLSADGLRTCIPGVETLTETGTESWDAQMKVGVAAIRGTYKGKVSISDKQEPQSYVLHVEGSGGPGFVKGSAMVTLAPEGAGTMVSVDGDGHVGGMLAGVAQRMLPGVAKMLMNQFFECLQARLGSPQAV